MASVPPTDWAWPRLLDSLQRDIARLQETVEDMRRESVEARERHREELDKIIAQLRAVQNELSPLVSDREQARKARRELIWDWFGRAGWIAIAGLLIAGWHYLTKHVVGE